MDEDTSFASPVVVQGTVKLFFEIDQETARISAKVPTGTRLGALLISVGAKHPRVRRKNYYFTLKI
jgi:hypothetical protein